MRKILLTVLFVFIAHASSAPSLDLKLKMKRFMCISEYVAKRNKEIEFLRFITDLGRRESGNNWLCINCIGCFGEWQFAESTLNYLGYKKITLKRFRANPGIFPREMQMKALKSLIKVNLALLADYNHFIGDTINGIPVTVSGMIAASHLGGAGSLKRYLNSKGNIDHQDVLGTAISDYLREFHQYDLEN
jgi:hypothetical protein